ncbi:MAG: PA2169 family four-helix-bundle protein [Burkholderiaceae bacterium]|jgi:uncharacterized protein (TIGR02284 family)
MSNEHIVSILNDLIAVSKDGYKGFQASAKDVKNQHLKQVFLNYATSCESGARELQELVRTFGGEPANDGTTMGALHRGWADLKSAVTGKDDTSILNECERGEDVAKAAYTEALKKDLPGEIRTIVERQLDGVKRIHGHVKSLRDQHHEIQESV